jgi:hypothetical protein
MVKAFGELVCFTHFAQYWHAFLPVTPGRQWGQSTTSMKSLAVIAVSTTGAAGVQYVKKLGNSRLKAFQQLLNTIIA